MRRRTKEKRSDGSESEAEQDAAWLRENSIQVFLEPESDEVEQELAAAAPSGDFSPSELGAPTAEQEKAALQTLEREPVHIPSDHVSKRLSHLPTTDVYRVFIESVRRQASEKKEELECEAAAASKGEEFARSFDRSMLRMIHKKRRRLQRALAVIRNNIDTKFEPMCTEFVELRIKMHLFESDPSLTGSTKSGIISSASSKIKQKQEAIAMFMRDMCSFINECISTPIS